MRQTTRQWLEKLSGHIGALVQKADKLEERVAALETRQHSEDKWSEVMSGSIEGSYEDSEEEAGV